MALTQLQVTEQVLRFGPQASGVAIVSRPKEWSQRLQFVVLLNAGLIHHVGPSRIYVQLARTMAGAGRVVCRVDLDGIGDSLFLGEQGPLADEASQGVTSRIGPATTEHGVRALLDQLQAEFGFGDVCLIGICRGADVAFDVARHDERVTSCVLVNGNLLPQDAIEPWLAYAERRAQLRQYRRKLTNPVAWTRLLSGRSGLGGKSLTRGPPSKLLRPTQRSPKGALARCVANSWQPLVERSCTSLLLYSELSSSADVFRLLIEAYLPSSPLITARTLGGADHAFILKEAQHALTAAISAHFGEAPPIRSVP